MDFFEVWEKSINVFNSPIPNDPYLSLTDRERNIARRIRSATIEALKEMIVGEPMPGKLAHTDTILGLRYTDVFFNEQFDDFCISEEWIDIDNQKVVVVVFKRP